MKLTEVRTLTRDQVVPYYVDLIVNCMNDDPEIKRVNKLILSKWTSSGLIYIKEKAWAIVAKYHSHKVKDRFGFEFIN